MAAAQVAPVFLDLAASVRKACGVMHEAADGGARLVVFPEAFLPAYPFWTWFVPAGDSHTLRALYAELLENAVAIPSESTDQLCEAARAASIHVAIGVNEVNTESSGTSLYNAILYIGADGRILGKHRKLIPTGGERLVHARGDGSTLDVHDTPIGRLGGLICWENYMPLARYAVQAAGVELYVAPTWDRGEPWISTLRHIAKESRAYVIGTGSALHRDHIPDRYAFKALLPRDLDWINPGDSAIIDPDGKFVVEPVRGREAILYGEVNLTSLRGSRSQLDVAGHYSRPDLFELSIRRAPTSPQPRR